VLKGFLLRLRRRGRAAVDDEVRPTTQITDRPARLGGTSASKQHIDAMVKRGHGSKA